jgi:cytochrome P450
MPTPPPISYPRIDRLGSCPVAHTAPEVSTEARVPVHTPEFAADPHRIYHRMRTEFGDLAPIELAPGVPATLVLGYQTAVRILHDSEHFPADPRTWQTTVPPESPVLPMMRWHPAARHSTGPDHQRYRQASKDSIDAVDGHAMHMIVEELAAPLINGFCESGTAELVGDYARPLVVAVLNQIMGCPPGIGERVTAGTAARFDTVDAAAGMGLLRAALTELIRLKRDHPGEDATSRLLAHPHGLDDGEVLAQLLSFYGAGGEAQLNLITNTLLLMMTDERFGGGLIGGSLSTWLPAHQPVLIGLAAANTDPRISDGDHTGNRSHLSWSAGPHACPARTLAYQIVQDAIDQLLDAVPDMALAVPRGELVWRPGPFHRALTRLPVTFRPCPAVTLPSPHTTRG